MLNVRRFFLLTIIITLFLGGIMPPQTAQAIGPVSLLSLTRFECEGPAFDVLMRGVFSADDQDGLDVFQLRVEDGTGLALYDMVILTAARPERQAIAISSANGPMPLANPIRIMLYEHDGSGITGVAASREVEVGCLPDLVALSLPERTVIVDEPDVPPVTIEGLPVIIAPPALPLLPPLAFSDGIAAMAQFNVNMRAQPDARAAQITLVGEGTPLQLLGRTQSGVWVLAQDSNGNIGWIITGAQSMGLHIIGTLPPVA